ncbi:hypothetical protein GGP98_002744 [Salinibacter ruber]|nr:hypothetical protein [Salinibacter ruber]
MSQTIMIQVEMVQVAALSSTSKNGQDRAPHKKKEGKY